MAACGSFSAVYEHSIAAECRYLFCMEKWRCNYPMLVCYRIYAAAGCCTHIGKVQHHSQATNWGLKGNNPSGFSWLVLHAIHLQNWCCRLNQTFFWSDDEVFVCIKCYRYLRSFKNRICFLLLNGRISRILQC